jgi:hypothetical protein
VQVATSSGFILGIEPTDRRRDSGLVPAVIARIVERCGRVPQRVLADTSALTRQAIVVLAERYPDLTIYSPPPPQRLDVTAETLRHRHWKRHERPALQAWRARMVGEEGQQTYRRRKLTERLHAQFKSRMPRFAVHGRRAVHAGRLSAARPRPQSPVGAHPAGPARRCGIDSSMPAYRTPHRLCPETNATDRNPPAITRLSLARQFGYSLDSRRPPCGGPPLRSRSLTEGPLPDPRNNLGKNES